MIGDLRILGPHKATVDTGAGLITTVGNVAVAVSVITHSATVTVTAPFIWLDRKSVV